VECLRNWTFLFTRLSAELQCIQGVNGGAGDAFLSKINTNSAVSGAAGPAYSTLLGGAGLDQGNGIAVDASGNAYVAGLSNSLSLGTAGAYQTNCTAPSGNTCEGDAFVAKFNPSATGAASELYFTYVGGSLADSATGVAVDTSGDAYITGSTVSTDYPTTADAFQRTYGGGNADAFVTKLDPAGATLLYSSYLGGTNTDVANGIAIDKATPPGAYIAGQTCSQDFPLSNPAQATPGGNCDAFVFQSRPPGRHRDQPDRLSVCASDAGNHEPVPDDHHH